MLKIRNSVGGAGNIMFKQAYLWAQMRKGLIPDVYVQSDKYWKGFEDEIKQVFGHVEGKINKVSIQVRRGDYLKLPLYKMVSDDDYYEKATNYFPDAEFLIFCHDGQDPEQDKKDKDWCQKYFSRLIPGRFEINEAGEEMDDMNKMASCEHNIIANSTFGWWAAYLNPNPDKLVICPKDWFSDGIQRCDLPDSFIKI